jgi:predicted PurR-regulated permease PerM
VLLIFVYAGHAVLVAFGGVLFAILLRAFIDCVERLPFIGKRWSFAATLAIILIVAGGVGYGLGPRVLQQTHDLAETVPKSVSDIQDFLQRYDWGRELMRVGSQSMHGEQVANRASNYASELAAEMADGVVIIAIGLFLANRPAYYRRGALLLFPAKHRDRAGDVLDEIASTVRGWLVGQLIPMSVLGVGSFIGLLILGVPLAFALALLTALMLFLPYAGTIIAYVPTALIALAKGPVMLLDVSILYLGVHMAEAYLVTPLAQRHTIRLPPALTLLMQLLMWKIGGILGLAVAAPLAAVCIVLVRKLYLPNRANLAAP